MKVKYSKKFDPENIGRKTRWKKNIADYQRDLASIQKPLTKIINHCPICRNNKNEVYCTVFDYDYKLCNNCDHIFSSSVVPQKKLEEYYSSLEEIKSTQGDVYLDKSIFHKRVESIAKPKFQFAINNINPIPSNKIWIDLGSGPGDLVFCANEGGWNAIGYEVDVEAVAFAKSLKINIIESSINSDFDYKVFNQADVISLINILEHIEDPSNFLQKISGNSRNGTYFLIEIPRHPCLSSLVNRMFPDYSNRHIYPPDHLHVFSDKSLNNLTELCSLSINAIWYFGQDFSDLLTSLSLFGELSNDSTFNDIFKLCNEVQTIFDRNKLSDTVLILAQKS
jgi:2-polyprenyl-3-methyl-5-hydroxy-6-metoxy-1,4-benzoquinol methylase